MPRNTMKKISDKGPQKTSKINIEESALEDIKNINESSPNKVAPDLSQFKFEKKPHIKIEYDNDCPTKQESKGIWEPKNWREFLLNLKIMRANYDAPVDTMGCHMSMDENASPQVYRYQCLISLMLSSQTKDQVTFAAMEKLRARGLTVDNVLQMSDEELGQLIYPVGFWKTKVKYIKKTTQTLKDQYNGDIPDSVDKLCKLTGVGPKMAHICMKVAWDKITGIGVDTHVHRISNRIGWVKKPTNTPEDTRKALETWIPFELWSEVNHLMVGFGQTICTPISPNCNECLNSDICPSSSKGKKTPKKSPKKENNQTIKTEKTASPAKKNKTDVKTESQAFETRKLLMPDIVTKNVRKPSLKKETLTKKEEKVIEKKDELVPETVTKIVKKASPKNKLANKQSTKDIEKLEDEDIKQPQNQPRVTRSKVQNTLEDDNGIKKKKSPLKRKSPKSKQSDAVSSSDSEGAVRKKTKVKESKDLVKRSH